MRFVVAPIIAVMIFAALPADAETIFPSDSYPELHQKMMRQDRAFYRFLAVPIGWSLEANLLSMDDLTLINQFLDQTESEDVKAVTGKHPYEMYSKFEEYGDLGMFGGVAVAATAFRYMTYKRDGASEEALADARADLIRAMETQHVFWEVTGTPGVVARGVERMFDEDPEAPAIPHQARNITPLADGDGNPLPAPKNNGTWRQDNSGGTLPADAWIWEDSCSKDQLIGQIFAMVLLYDAAVGDPLIPESLIERMRQDALATAQMLMTKREISEMEGPAGFGEYDLIIMDADGRPTFHHDLNPYSLEKLYIPNDSPGYNLFNLIMAFGAMKGLYHVTGDETIEQYIYQDLMGERGWLQMVNPPEDNKDVVDYIYMNLKTNYSNVNMIATAIWLALYTESDTYVAAYFQDFLKNRWWNRPGVSRTAMLSKMPFYNLIWMGVTSDGVDRALADQTAALLSAFPLGPYMNNLVINCDEAELEAGECLAIDGETVLILEDGVNRGEERVSTVALDPSIREPSNFDSRSDPFEVNGGGGDRMNPGGDLLAAYWMGRYLDLNQAGTRSVSPNVRDHIEVPGTTSSDPAPESVESVEPVENDVIEPVDVGGTDTESDATIDAVSTDSAVGDTQAADVAVSADEGGEGKPSSGCSSTNASGGSASPLVLLVFVVFAAVLRRRIPA